MSASDDEHGRSGGEESGAEDSEERRHRKRGRHSDEDVEEQQESSRVREKRDANGTREDGEKGGGQKKARKEGGGEGRGGTCIVRLRGLPWHTKEHEVQAFLEGVNVAAGGVVIMNNQSGEAYVRVETLEDEAKALRKNKEKLGRRYIEVFASSPEEMADADRRKRPEGAGHRRSGDFHRHGPAVVLSGNEGVIRMRGLPYHAAESDIARFFSSFRVIQGGIHMVPDRSGRASGQAYVVFESVHEAQQAMRLNKEKIGDRWIELFLTSHQELVAAVPSVAAQHGARRFPAQHSTAAAQPAAAAVPNLDMSGFQYVVKIRGLPFDCTRMDLLEFFRNAGPKENGIFFVSRMDGRASGEAFVAFKTPDGLQKALELDKQKMGQRWLDIYESNSNDLLSRVGAAVALADKGDASFKGVLKMRGLPFQTTVEDVVQFFKGYGVSLNGIFITNGPDGRVTGEAYVVFRSESEAAKARNDLNKRSIASRWIDLYQVTKGDLYTATVYSPIVGQPQGHGGCPIYANVPMTCVRLRNLPPSVVEKDLFRFFNDLQVIGLYICRDFSGRCTGDAYAEFGSLEDCQQAMSRNRDRIAQGERCIEVTAASKDEVLELIEMEKRGAEGGGGQFMGGGGGAGGGPAYNGHPGGGPWGGPHHAPAPVDYAAMARGGPGGGGGWGPGRDYSRRL